MGWIAGATLLTNSKVQRCRVLTATIADRGNRFTGFYNVTCRLEQALVMPIQGEITVAMVENDQKPGTTQPVGEHHSSAMHCMYLASGCGADHDAVPFGSLVITAGFTETRKQSTINRPWKFSPGLCKRSAVGNSGTGNDCAGGFDRATRCGFISAFTAAGAVVAGDGLSFALTFLFGLASGDQRLLASLFSFTCLSGQGFFDGLENLGQVGLILLTGLQFLIAGLVVLIQLGQCLLTLDRKSVV